ncbi:metallophosphoesterase [Pelagicoccus sp. SDUM812003]|uniref:metallophosphoesterase n=1 Tax=Pelagicoccus sp. SDUM812003 TaxID=3041267 RepID=UPI0028100E71|nr:metallophosphoesterase [Pelagicoccus sp. SDUM812003]MDQ8204580.1 metallophosphoesterase [Pelagicoccus sp. SDUM812003]
MQILIFVGLYGLINVYLFRTAWTAFPQLEVFWATSIGLLFLSLFAAVFLEKRKAIRASLPFSWIGYTWLGLAGIALTLAALTDLAQLFTSSLSDRAQFWIVAIGTGSLGMWAGWEAQRVRVKRVSMVSNKELFADRPLKIIQISDLHLGDSSSLKRVKKLVARINEEKPDLVVSTGDLFDGYLELMAPFVDALRSIDAPLGKFAVSGNHEVYAGLDDALSLTELAGFKPLRNEASFVLETMRVAGVEDPASPMRPDEDTALGLITNKAFTLLLKHRPAFEPASKGRFDLQLSGHTHGGQIAPFHLLTKLAYKAKPGLSELAPKQYLYLSRGTGSWGPQLRLLAPNELTVIEITPSP